MFVGYFSYKTVIHIKLLRIYTEKILETIFK